MVCIVAARNHKRTGRDTTCVDVRQDRERRGGAAASDDDDGTGTRSTPQGTEGTEGEGQRQEVAHGGGTGNAEKRNHVGGWQQVLRTAKSLEANTRANTWTSTPKITSPGCESRRRLPPARPRSPSTLLGSWYTASWPRRPSCTRPLGCPRATETSARGGSRDKTLELAAEIRSLFAAAAETLVQSGRDRFCLGLQTTVERGEVEREADEGTRPACRRWQFSACEVRGIN